jgi:hypothetical protein
MPIGHGDLGIPTRAIGEAETLEEAAEMAKAASSRASYIHEEDCVFYATFLPTILKCREIKLK